MQTGNVPTTLRRSSRVPTALSLLVTSMDGTHFSEVCETLVVNAHGCALLSPAKLDAGVPLHLHSKDGRETTAHVVYCQPAGSDNRSWRLGASLDRPDNFWGLKNCPKDWALQSSAVPAKLSPIYPPTTTLGPQVRDQASHPPEAALDRVMRQLEPPLRRLIADSIRPLQDEVVALREKLSRKDANPSRFEVSLGSIPPELEQQIETRLRKELGPRVLDEARQQSTQLMATAKAALDHRTSESYELYLRRVAEELKVVEKRAQETSAYISETAREQLRRGLEDFHKKLLEGGNSLKRLSEELAQFLQQNLNEEHNARRGDLEKLRSAVASESSRLHEHVQSLDSRIASLDKSARGLESGLDQRLSQMASHTVGDTRSQLEATANNILDDLAKRSSKTLGDQLEETSENLKIVQKGIVASGSDSLKAQAVDRLQAFDRSMEELAMHSVERWRIKLASGLNQESRRALSAWS